MIKTTTKQAKYTKRSDQEKRLIVRKAAELDVTGLSLNKIAMKLKVPKTTLLRLIKRDTLWSGFLKKKKQIVTAKLIESLEKDLKAQAKKRKSARFAELGLSAAIKFDKVFPQGSPALAQVNVGDKVVKVFYPEFNNPTENIERATTPIPIEEKGQSDELVTPQKPEARGRARITETTKPERPWTIFEQEKRD